MGQYIHDAEVDLRRCYGCDHDDCREFGCQSHEMTILDWSDFDPAVHRMPETPQQEPER